MKVRVWKKYLFAACAAASTLVSASLPIVLAGNSAYATTTGAVPPWEPDGGSATPYGNIVFYDASGNEVTSGNNLTSPFAYAVATTPADSGSTKAVLSFGLPQKGVVTANWNQAPESGTTTFTSLPSATPAAVKAFAPTYPVVVSTANISSWLGGHTPDANQDYANTIEVRLQDTAIFGTTSYWDTDIGYNNTSSPITIDETVNGGTGSIAIPANSWVQIFPSVTSTATALTSTLTSPQSPGTPIPLTATVTPSSTGSVNFYNNGTFLANVAVSGGTAHYTDPSPSAGSNSYTASFVPGTAPGNETGVNTTGASIVGGSTSSAFVMTIVAPATTTVVTSSTSGTSVVGQPVTYTATVTPNTGTGTPDGTVTFKDGTTAICTGVTLTSGSATCAPPAYTATGSHSITAVYSGSAGFQGSTSSALTQTVNPADTSTTLTAAPNPASQNGNVLLTATVSAVAPGAGNPTGTVDFKNGATTICTGTLAVGAGGDQATCNTSFASTGTDSLTAVYLTDGNYNGSTSSAVSEQVNPATTTTVTSSTSGTSVVGQPVTYTATVAPQSGTGTPDGTVTFKDGTTAICNGVTLVSGSATCSPPAYTATGSHSITAVYSGSTSFGGSTSSVQTQTVNQAATTTATVSSANPSVVGQKVSYTATVSVTSPGAGSPTGTMTFKDGGSNITGCANVAVTAGSATCDPAYPATGSHSITAVYSGDANFAGSTSSTLTQGVNPANTTTALSSSANPSNTGQQATYTATVTPVAPGAGTPTGTVAFSDGGSPISGCASQALTSGVATCQVTYATEGSHTITAAYSGDANYVDSSSGSLTQNVVKQVGYWLVGSDGGVFNLGGANYYGSKGGQHLNAPVVGMAPAHNRTGYWLAASDGGVFNFGDAGFFGSKGGQHLNAPVVGIAATPSGLGYWLVASDGGVFNFGDAGFFGSKGGQHLNAPVVGIVATPSGHGYWLVASDGGVFNFGDAGFFGSKGGQHLNAPVVGIAATPSGLGYWLVASDGGVFNFGDAGYFGSEGGTRLNQPIVGMAPTSDGAGYRLIAADGGVFGFGDGVYLGSLPGEGISVHNIVGGS